MTEDRLYTRTITVTVIPMNRGAYIKYRGWMLLPKQDPDDEGYLIERIDHLGCISWIPKDKFKQVYKQIFNISIDQEEIDWLDQLKKEYEDLNTSIVKFHKFINSNINSHQYNLIQLQIDTIKNLLSILDKHIHIATQN